MRASTKRILSIAGAVVFFIGAVVIYANLIRPQMDDINKLRATLLAKSNLLSRQKEVVSQVQNLIAQFQNVGRVREAVSLAVPNGEQNVAALRQIEAVARVSGVTLTSLDFKTFVGRTPAKRDAASTPETQDLIKKLGKIQVKVVAVGSYQGLRQFLARIEESARVANVQAFGFVPTRGSDNADRLSIDFEMYFQE
ncbi:MAG: hypothetical protein AAB601_00160 [Patescibacteria group bacterium]